MTQSSSEIAAGERYHEGQEHSHLGGDSSVSTMNKPLACKHFANIGYTEDQRSIANRLAAEEKKSEPGDNTETKMSKKDATLPVSFGHYTSSLL